MKLLSIAIVMLILLSCSHESRKSEPTFKMNEIQSLDRKPQVAQFEMADTSRFQINSSPQHIEKEKNGQNPDWEKKIVKIANLDMEVKDYKSYYASLHQKVRDLGGYIAQEEQTQSEYRIENSVSIKIPVDQFDNGLNQLSDGVQKVNERKISSDDVTTEVVDIKSRMAAKKQVRQRYMDLLTQAKNMEEILNVQSEINSIQEELESAEGRIEYLSHASVFSTINLKFSQILNASAKNPDQKPSFGTRFSSAFKEGGKWILDLVVGLISIWPLLLMIFIMIVILRKAKIFGAKKVVQQE